MHCYPFSDSETLAEWVCNHLKDRGIDEVSDWRMLEYWFQVEIFRLARLNRAGTWQHVGNYEQPYHTELPRSGSKTKTKWIDLVMASPKPEDPEAVVWIELKDIGRSKKRQPLTTRRVWAMIWLLLMEWLNPNSTKTK